MQSSRASQEIKEVRLRQGIVRYREAGEGPTIVFVHGILVNGALWRKVIPPLAEHYRCIALDLPLGAHQVPMNPDADLSPAGVAKIIADVLEILDLQDITLVGNDTGGALCQVVVADHPERLSRLVLTNCDAYEDFFPLPLKPFHYGPKFFGRRSVDVLARILRARFAQRTLMRTVAQQKMDTVTLDTYMENLIRKPGVRQDVTYFLRNVSNRYTLDAARSFGAFDRPVLIIWGEDDFFFSSKLARRLQKDFPNATLQSIPDSRAFVPEDQPERLAASIRDFMRSHSDDRYADDGSKER